MFVCVLVAFLGVIINDDERWETPRTRQGANTDSSRTGSNQVREDVDEVLVNTNWVFKRVIFIQGPRYTSGGPRYTPRAHGTSKSPIPRYA